MFALYLFSAEEQFVNGFRYRKWGKRSSCL